VVTPGHGSLLTPRRAHWRSCCTRNLKFQAKRNNKPRLSELVLMRDYEEGVTATAPPNLVLTNKDFFLHSQFLRLRLLFSHV